MKFKEVAVLIRQDDGYLWYYPNRAWYIHYTKNLPIDKEELRKLARKLYASIPKTSALRAMKLSAALVETKRALRYKGINLDNMLDYFTFQVEVEDRHGTR